VLENYLFLLQFLSSRPSSDPRLFAQVKFLDKAKRGGYKHFFLMLSESGFLL
jgi:hypothetical protein